jgi:hypothetical protein
MEIFCESNKNTQTVQYGAESANNLMRYPVHLITESEHTARTDFVLNMSQQQMLNYLIDLGEFGAQQIFIIEQIAKHYTQRGVPLIDLIWSIDRGMTDALDKFKEISGYCFSSYLMHSIYHCIERTFLSMNTLTGSFQTRRAPALSFDNTAHQRWRI